MYAIIFLLVPQNQTIELSDINRFPTSYESSTQLGLCQAWRRYLEWEQLHHANRKSYSQTLKQLEWMESYYTLIIKIRDPGWGGDPWRFTLLGNLHNLLGPALYYKGYRPPELGTEPPKPPSIPMVEEC